jgi:hypothetical protein
MSGYNVAVSELDIRQEAFVSSDEGASDKARPFKVARLNLLIYLIHT